MKGLVGFNPPDLSNMVTQLWALHMGVAQAKLMNLEHICLETDNLKPFHEITRMDGKGDPSVAWIVEQIKKLLDEEAWTHKVILVNENTNKSAYYLATVGLKKFTSMREFFTPFGRLQERLDLDMGFGSSFPQLRITPIPSLGTLVAKSEALSLNRLGLTLVMVWRKMNRG